MTATRRPHVCIVTTAHPRDDVRVGSRIMSAFLGAGYRVTWVGPDFSHFKEGGGTGHKAVDYRLFPSARSRSGRLRAAGRAKSMASGVRDVDWWYSPDPDAAALIVRLARKSGGRTMFDIHESYHGGLLNRWFPGRPPNLVREALRRRITRTCRRIDLVIGVSHAVLSPYTTPADETLVVRNCAPAWFAADRPATAAPDDRKWVMHGKVAVGNGTPTVIEAAALLPEGVARNVSIQMLEQVGAGDSSFGRQVRDRVESLPHRPVDLRPGVGHEEMAALMGQCQIGLISYQRDLGLESLPNRLFEYMAAGLAILAPSYSPEIVAILESERIGLHADFEDPQEIADSLAWLVEHPDEVAAMGARAREAFLTTYNWDAEARNLTEKMRSMES